MRPIDRQRNSRGRRAGVRLAAPLALGLALMLTSSRGPLSGATPPRAMLTVSLAPGSAVGEPAAGVTGSASPMFQGHTVPGHTVGMDSNGDGKMDRFVRSDGLGNFRIVAPMSGGAESMSFAVMNMGSAPKVSMMIVSTMGVPDRPFDGSPTPPGRPFTRLLPNSVAYAPGLPPRPDARAISRAMTEDPGNPAFAPNIELGLVFLGQFVDHDLTLNSTRAGQGASVDPAHPVNLRTPALDLDSVYGGGPQADPQYYTPDGLFFRLGPGGGDLLRGANGEAIIPEARNDDNGLIAEIHLAFQKFHNMIVASSLKGVAPSSLSPAQRQAIFGMAHSLVIAYFQGMVANQFGPKIIGAPIPDADVPPSVNTPVEFAAAAFRLGHTLVPNTVVIDDQGTTTFPTDPAIRGGVKVPYRLLFGPTAQHAARFDALLSMTMHTLLIPISPSDPRLGDLIGGNSPNIGVGHILGNVMHLDLAETNVMRGREQQIPSGEEYLAMLDRRPYNPTTDGNTDLFPYILHEATPQGHLGRVGADIIVRTIGGTLAADPNRYDNPAVWSPQQIASFRSATMESLLHQIGTPGF